MLRTMRLLSSIFVTALISSISYAGTTAKPSHAVYVLTNDADNNEVVVFEQSSSGSFQQTKSYSTGGRGSGGSFSDVLESQGALTLSQDHAFLFAVNAGSGEVSVFSVQGTTLALVDREPTGGGFPVSVAQHGSLVYVLNQGGSGAVVGFSLTAEGHLKRIPNAVAPLSANLVDGTQVSISPDGQILVAIEQFVSPVSLTQKSNNIDIFRINPDGTLGPIVENPGLGAGTFSSSFTSTGQLVVAEAGVFPNSPNATGISSYNITANGTLTPISQSVPTQGVASCWNVLTPNGKFAYVASFVTANIAGFQINANGILTPIGSTIVGSNPANSDSTNLALSIDGQFLFNQNPNTATISVYTINSDGTLTPFQIIENVPGAVAVNGLAAI